MATLPSELWVIIFDMVIVEEIVRLDQCDYNTFPHEHLVLSPKEDPYRFFRSYHQLRLVCRSFNALLGSRPYCDLKISSSPFPASIKTLRIIASDESHSQVFRQNFTDLSRCERLLYLDVSCWIDQSSSQLNLSEIISAGEAGAFPNVQRLILWLISAHYSQCQPSFWGSLHRGFPLLVTLSIELNWWQSIIWKVEDRLVTFERLETLYFGGVFTYSKCNFPRLRHASVESLPYYALEPFRRSPHLESLIIRSVMVATGVDVGPFSSLRVLSIIEDLVYNLVPLGCDHSLEHLWIYLANASKNPSLIEEVVTRIPRILRITLDLSSVTPDQRVERIQEFKGMRLEPFGLALKPIKVDDNLLVIEWSPTLAKEH